MSSERRLMGAPLYVTQYKGPLAKMQVNFTCHNLAIARVPCYYAFMIRAFKNVGTEDIFYGKNTSAARQTCPQNLWKIAARKLDQLDSVSALAELRIPPGNRLEPLSGNRQGQYSIRINDQYRICFIWAETEPDEVEIVDYH